MVAIVTKTELVLAFIVYCFKMNHTHEGASAVQFDKASTARPKYFEST
jgi:hypothetical protein